MTRLFRQLLTNPSAASSEEREVPEAMCLLAVGLLSLGLFGAEKACAQFPQQVITTESDSVPQSVFSTDVDGDGDADVFTASSRADKISWYENQVGESGTDADGFGDQQVITTSADGATSVHAVDIDGDEDADVLSASSLDDKIAWYENQVGENEADEDGFGNQQVITNDALIAYSVHAADVDGDGDKDALSAFGNSGLGRIAWYENQVGESGADEDGFGDQQLIGFPPRARSVFAADVDGDGDKDALSASIGNFRTESEVAWYENQVGESGADEDGFGPQQVITSSVNVAKSVHAADVDGDGDKDALSASSADFDSKIAWYENQVGENGADADGFGSQQIITTHAAGTGSVFAADLDGDGDADALSASGDAGLDNKIAWYENQVGESGADEDGFGDQQVITYSQNEAHSVFATDVDGDGDNDPLSASGGVMFGKIAWYRNDLTSILSKVSSFVDSNGEVDFEATGADINFSGVSGSGTVTVTKFGTGATDTTGISESTVSSYRFTISAHRDLTFDASTEVQLDVGTLDGINDASNVTVYKRSNEGAGEFSALSTSFDSGANELVATTGSFSEFVLASNTEPLPVELASFGATVENDAVRLTWQTASETGNARFEVQRRAGDAESGGRGDWETVGRRQGARTTSEVQRYRFTDDDLPYAAEALTYRLRQVDTDGSAQFSETVTVERTVDEVELLGTYPNPARGRATVRYALPEKQEVSLTLYDVLGRQVRTVVQAEKKGRHERRLDTSALPSGVYFLRLRAGGQTRTQKLTVVR